MPIEQRTEHVALSIETFDKPIIFDGRFSKNIFKTPSIDSRQLSPGSIQRSTPRSPPTPPIVLPPIHRRESPSPPSPAQPSDQPSPRPRLPPIHGDPGSESHTANAAAEEESPSRRSSNPHLPADWDSYSKKKRDRWFKAQTQDKSPETEPPETSHAQKTKNWSTMPSGQKKRWIHQNP